MSKQLDTTDVDYLNSFVKTFLECRKMLVYPRNKGGVPCVYKKQPPWAESLSVTLKFVALTYES